MAYTSKSVCDCVCAYSCIVAWLLEDIWCSHITHDQWPWTDDGLLSKWQDFWSFISFVVEINLSVTNRGHREKVWMEIFPVTVHLLTVLLCWLLMGQPLQQQLLQLAPISTQFKKPSRLPPNSLQLRKDLLPCLIGSPMGTADKLKNSWNLIRTGSCLVFFQFQWLSTWSICNRALIGSCWKSCVHDAAWTKKLLLLRISWFLWIFVSGYLCSTILFLLKLWKLLINKLFLTLITEANPWFPGCY